MKKANAILEIAILLLLVFSVNALALNNTSAVLRIESKNVHVGETFEIVVKIENNPGIIAANINVTFDEELVLVDAFNGDAFSTLTYIPPRQLATSKPISSNCNFAWQGFDIDDKDIRDGTILTLRFELSRNAKAGETYNISITNKMNDVVDKNLNPVVLSAQGKIKATSHKLVKIEAQAATCTQNGNITYYKCSSCGNLYTDSSGKKIISHGSTVVKAKGHEYGAWKTIKKATCKEEGKQQRICAVCKNKEFKPISKVTIHTYKQTTEKATLSKNGSIVTRCKVCGKNKSIVVIEKISSITLSTTKYTYNGKIKTPTVTVKDSKKNILKNNTDYTVTYASGRKTPGQYAVKITFKGNYSGSKTLYFTILPGVTSSIATTTNSSAIKLAWKAVPGATGYRVFQYDAKTKKYVTLKTTTGTSYTVTKLKSGTSYKFAVKAYSTVNGKVYWASGYKTVTATTNPGTPTLKVTAGSKKATLSWNKQTGATGYVVYMATSQNGKYSKIATLKGNSSVTYTKTGLTKGKTYYFKVVAYTVANGKTLYSSYSFVKAVKIK